MSPGTGRGPSTDAAYDVQPLTSQTWPAFEAMVQRHNGIFAQAGGGVVEAYPHDLTDQVKKMSSSFLYNGTRGLYERVGFSYVRPKGKKNCVMSIEVSAHP